MRGRWFATVILLLVGAASTRGDMVRLKNGSKFEGVVTRQAPDTIEMKVRLQGEMTFLRDQIETLVIAGPMENLLIVEQWEREGRETHRRDGGTAPAKPDRGGVDIPRNPASRADPIETDRLIKSGARDRSDNGNAVLSRGDWEHRDTQNFTVFYEDDATGKELSSRAEYFLEKTLYDLGMKAEEIRGPRKFEVFIIKDQEQWNEIARKQSQLEFTIAFALVAKREIFVRVTGYNDEVPTFAHELSHIVLWLFCKNRAVPLWVHEGFAIYESGQMGYGGKQLLNALRQGKLYSIRDLHDLKAYPSERDMRLLFYLQSAKIVEYMITQHGRHRFAKFTSLLAEGSALDSALRRVFPGPTGTIQGFEKAWLKYLTD
ncbi:MAG: peptidase MA family metallohydrolase [Planctomycetota bacterium]